jgi:DNA-binding transcriptional ArsR family regulator
MGSPSCATWRTVRDRRVGQGPYFRLDLYNPFVGTVSVVHAFDVLGDPVRRRILELLADGESSSGAITEVIRQEFGISQPAVSAHLKVLRDNGFATVRVDRNRRLYTVDSAPLREIDEWLERFRGFWDQRLDALATELARGKRTRRTNQPPRGTP